MSIWTDLIGWLLEQNEVLGAWASVVQLIGIPVAIGVYGLNKRRERLDREYGTYHALDDKYIEYLKLAVKESPQTASLHMKLGNALEEAKAYGKAVQQWRMVLDLEPDHPERTQLLNLIKKHVHSLAQRNADKAS